MLNPHNRGSFGNLKLLLLELLFNQSILLVKLFIEHQCLSSGFLLYYNEASGKTYVPDKSFDKTGT